MNKDQNSHTHQEYFSQKSFFGLEFKVNTLAIFIKNDVVSIIKKHTTNVEFWSSNVTYVLSNNKKINVSTCKWSINCLC